MSSSEEQELERSLLAGGGAGRPFDLLAAALRADSGDAAAYLGALAAKLVAALPAGTVTVERAGGLFSKEKPVRRIVVDLSGQTLTATIERGRLSTVRAKAVRGVVLKNDIVEFAEWIDVLAQALAAEAERSASTRAALERLLL